MITRHTFSDAAIQYCLAARNDKDKFYRRMEEVYPLLNFAEQMKFKDWTFFVRYGSTRQELFNFMQQEQAANSPEFQEKVRKLVNDFTKRIRKA